MAYNVNIRFSSKELTPIERIQMKDVSNAISLDSVVTPTEPLMIHPVAYSILDVHNDKSDTGDYTKYVIEDDNGERYTTGSESFFDSFEAIHKELTEAGLTYTLIVFKKESQNYKGKYFLTCTVK